MLEQARQLLFDLLKQQDEAITNRAVAKAEYEAAHYAVPTENESRTELREKINNLKDRYEWYDLLVGQLKGAVASTETVIAQLKNAEKLEKRLDILD